MKFEEFFNEVEQRELEVEFDRPSRIRSFGGSNEAMFHLPLIAISILMLSKGRAKPSVEVIGQLVGECFERTFVGFRGSAQHLGWSATLRVRTAQALSFLETANLVSVDPASRAISATEPGRAIVQRALEGDSDLRSTLYVVDRSYRNIRAEIQQRLQLS